ncbi:MAG: S8 family serine peptidase [Pelagibacteraceae bacterium]
MAVDVILIDSHLQFDHPEFDTRAQKFNWLKYSKKLGYETSDEYQYENVRPFKGRFGTHGTSMAGIIGGNTLGIAPNVNIFNIHYNYDWYIKWKDIFYDYIIEFVKERKNPTICNMSIAYKTTKVKLENLTSCAYRGNIINLENLDNKQKQDALAEIIPPEHFYGDDFLRHLPIRHKSVDDGIKKLIDNGIIVVGSARNSSLAVDVPGGIDYDNKISRKIFGDFYLNRGSSPGCSPGIITVSSLHRGGNGPRIDYFEDGSDTLTSVKYRTVGSAIKDFRSDNHEVAYVEGTSVATAKITGRLALELEKNPNLSQNDAINIQNKNKNGNAV